jgi:hypothetical protein
MRDLVASAPAERIPTLRHRHANQPVALSEIGRFNSLIADFVALFVGFISLFGHLGNLHSDVSRNQ